MKTDVLALESGEEFEEESEYEDEEEWEYETEEEEEGSGSNDDAQGKVRTVEEIVPDVRVESINDGHGCVELKAKIQGLGITSYF